MTDWGFFDWVWFWGFVLFMSFTALALVAKTNIWLNRKYGGKEDKS